MILVTGGTGFLGSVLIRQLVESGKSVFATKRNSSVIPEVLKSSSLVQWIDADVTDYYALKDSFLNVKQVYHCAAKILFDSKEKKKMMHTNVEGTKNIVNLCLENNTRLMFVSSVAALGTSQIGDLASEDNKWSTDSDVSPYALAKYHSEMEVWRGIMEGLDAVIVNPSVILGAGCVKSASNALFDFIEKGLKFYPSGSVGIVDVEDVARAMILLMGKTEFTGERFVLNGSNILYKDLIDRVSVLLNKKAPTIEATPFLLSCAWRLARVASYFKATPATLSKYTARHLSESLMYDNSKVVNRLGFSFKHTQDTLEQIRDTYYSK